MTAAVAASERPCLVIRADGNATIGTGHVMRCLALAQCWQDRGGRVVFVSAEIVPALTDRLNAEAIVCVSIGCTRGSNADAVETAAVATSNGARWVVADGYCFGLEWQRKVRAAGYRLLLLDDYGHHAQYAADVVLNQNSSATTELYPAREASHLLLGARFALLRREFCRRSEPARSIPAVAQKVLVTIGGGDAENVTAKAVLALRSIESIEAVIVAGGSNPHVAALQALISGDARLKLLVNPTNMPELMAWADVAITAAGSTVWEAAYCGLPSALLVVADNQIAIAEDLTRRGVCVNLGQSGAASSEAIAETVRALLLDADRRKAMAEKAAALVDGFGPARVAAVLGAPLRITFATDRDSWVNAELRRLADEFQRNGHTVTWVHDPASMPEGDLAFLLSLSRIVARAILRRNAHNLVVHASALPKGRGMSPMTWQVLEGKNEIPVSLIEAADAVDFGEIYRQDTITLSGGELVEELHAAVADSTVRLCRYFVENYPFILGEARAQVGEPSYYRRRRPPDSRLDPDKTLREQFNLLRVSDPDRYPAFFEINGRRYNVRITHAPSPE